MFIFEIIDALSVFHLCNPPKKAIRDANMLQIMGQKRS